MAARRNTGAVGSTGSIAAPCTALLQLDQAYLIQPITERQKNTIPPSATPFIRASFPTTGLDIVRLSSVTSVTLFVSP